MSTFYIDDVQLSSESEAKIQSIIERHEFEVRTTLIHLALAQFRNRDKSQEEILQESVDALRPAIEQMERGESRPVGEVFSELREKIKNLPPRPEGKLSLPKRLYDYVNEQTLSGQYESAAALIEAAVRRYDPRIATEVIP